MRSENIPVLKVKPLSSIYINKNLALMQESRMPTSYPLQNLCQFRCLEWIPYAGSTPYSWIARKYPIKELNFLSEG